MGRRIADGQFLPVFTKIILTFTARFYAIVSEKDVNTYDPKLMNMAEWMDVLHYDLVKSVLSGD